MPIRKLTTNAPSAVHKVSPELQVNQLTLTIPACQIRLSETDYSLPSAGFTATPADVPAQIVGNIVQNNATKQLRVAFGAFRSDVKQRDPYYDVDNERPILHLVALTMRANATDLNQEDIVLYTIEEAPNADRAPNVQG
jgi:hypothetical protein